MFVLPGIGPIVAAGPVVETIAGGAAGAAVGGGGMAGAGAASELGVALRTEGIDDEQLERLHAAIADGEVVIINRCRGADCGPRRQALEATEPDELLELPFGGVLHRD